MTERQIEVEKLIEMSKLIKFEEKIDRLSFYSNILNFNPSDLGPLNFGLTLFYFSFNFHPKKCAYNTNTMIDPQRIRRIDGRG